MITENDVLTVLSPIIIDSPMGDGEKVIVLDDKESFVYVSFFENIFSDAKSMSAADLHDVDNTKNLGYSTYIGEWKSKGYII